MVHVIRSGDSIDLNLPGRKSQDIVSSRIGSEAVTLRLVEIPVPQPGDSIRPMHRHDDFEECIYVLSGRGTTESEHGQSSVEVGDTILVSPGELHVTRNTGDIPLQMLCFFPTADCSEQK